MSMPGLNTLSSFPKGDDNKVAISDDSDDSLGRVESLVSEETVDESRFSKYSISLISVQGSKLFPSHFPGVDMGQENAEFIGELAKKESCLDKWRTRRRI
ncbi:hypothetical protein Tco_1398962 [Tanacetum coccineum]